jgi:dynein heavy chain
MKDPTKFVEQLMDFKNKIDNQEVPKANVDACRPYLSWDKFTGKDMYTKSRAAAGITEWVINICEYFDIVALVEPKRRALADAQAQLAAANSKLEEVTARVAQLQEELNVLEVGYNTSVMEKNAVEAEMDKLEKKLSLAQRLVNALTSENVRWTDGVEKLESEKVFMVGDVLLGAAFVSYVGCFSKMYRDRLVEKFIEYLESRKILFSEEGDPIAILATDAQVAAWSSEGLPSDRVSVEVSNMPIATTHNCSSFIAYAPLRLPCLQSSDRGCRLYESPLRYGLRRCSTACLYSSPVLIDICRTGRLSHALSGGRW